jgi:hypothetical protein
MFCEFGALSKIWLVWLYLWLGKFVAKQLVWHTLLSGFRRNCFAA